MNQISETVHVAEVDAAIRRLITAEHFVAGSMVSMPVLYPSGASVVLEVTAQTSTAIISDRGGGFREIEPLGAVRQFATEAARIATDFGITFDGRDFVIDRVPLDRLDGAMTVVAAASSQAATRASRMVRERRESADKDEMLKKLSNVFGSDGFKRDVEIIGASNHRWTIDALIDTPETRIVFNSVSQGPDSIKRTVVTFFDLSRLEVAPRRIAIVRSIIGLGDWYGVVAGAADAVLELDAANDQFLKARRAA